jgi:hypothetical protein
LLHFNGNDVQRMPRTIELGRAIRKRDDAGPVRPDAIEDDSPTGCDSWGGTDAAHGPFAHQGADVIAR